VRASSLFSIIALGLAFMLCAVGPALGESGIIRNEHFVVRYHSADPFLARVIADNAEQQLWRIAHDLGYPLEHIRRFSIDAYPSHADFVSASKLENRSSIVGTTRLGDEAIAVDAGAVLVSTKEVLAHEITHAVLFRILGRNALRMPVWFDEGLAKYESREYDATDSDIVARAAADNELIPLTDLASGFPEDKGGLAYAESADALKYMVHRFGRSAPRRVVHELRRSGSFDRAMLSVTGADSSRFADRWYDWTTRRDAGFRLASVGTAVISAVMAMLVVAAFLTRRRQKIEAARRWEQEDAQANEADTATPPWSGNRYTPGQ
jgi:hypothetical protein